MVVVTATVKLVELLAKTYRESPEQFRAIANLAETVVAATRGRDEEPAETVAAPER